MATVLHCNASNYYAAAGAWSSLNGSALLARLHSHISGDDINSLPYTSSTNMDTWDALYVLDADESDANRVIELYSQRSVALNMSGLPDGWNREHVWPKSYGVGYSGADYTDLHHLRAADWGINSARGNKPFGECSPTRDSTCVSPAHAEAAYDTAANPNLFMPPAAVRGDIARALFYMVARYDGTNSYTENLVLSKCPSSLGYAMGNLSLLLAWHAADPADSREVWRTGKVCELYQGNRNPFVDDASLPERIWGAGTDFYDEVCHTDYVDGTSSPSSWPVLAPTSTPTSANQNAETCLQLTAAIDGDRSGGLPKAVELFVLCDIPNPSDYGLGTANNGGGTDGEEFTFPSSGLWKRGDFLWVSYDSPSYPNSFDIFFGFAPNHTAACLYVNGDDAIELYHKGKIVDRYGNSSYSNSPTWSYANGWAYRAQGTIATGIWADRNWHIQSGVLGGFDSNNAVGENEVPIKTYQLNPSPNPTSARSTGQTGRPTPTPSWSDTMKISTSFSLSAPNSPSLEDRGDLKTTLMSSLGLATESNIKDFSVTSSLQYRRRLLSSYSWYVSFKILINALDSEYDSTTSAAADFASILAGSDFEEALKASLGVSVVIDTDSIKASAEGIPTMSPTRELSKANNSSDIFQLLSTKAGLGVFFALLIVIALVFIVGKFICNRQQDGNDMDVQVTSTDSTTVHVAEKSVIESSNVSLGQMKYAPKEIIETRNKTFVMVEGRVIERRRQVWEQELNVLKKKSNLLSEADKSLSHQI